MEKRTGKLYSLLAGMLEYPTPDISERARECAAVLGPGRGPAKEYIEGFLKFSLANPSGRLEEIYTDTFDLQAVCHPYVGCYLFREDPRRGMFMARLKELYRSRGFLPGGDLPDHLAVMLRFLSRQEPDEEARDLIEFCLVPAVNKMLALFKDGGNPYQNVLKALLMMLEAEAIRS